MKNTLVFLIFVLAAVNANGSATTCPTGAYSLYLLPNFTCSTDSLIFKNFGYSTSPGGIDPSAILVMPITGPGFGFQFKANFTVIPGQTITYIVGYDVDPPPIIHGEQIDLDPFGSVSLQTDLCITAFPCAPGNSLGTLNASTASTMASIQFPNTSTMGVRNTLTLTGGNTGANSQGFDNMTFTTPEPSSILLAASGLLALLAFRRRAKLRKVRLQ